jgi:hypothetical protein
MSISSSQFLEKGGLKRLLEILKNPEEDTEVRSKALYSISGTRSLNMNSCYPSFGILVNNYWFRNRIDKELSGSNISIWVERWIWNVIEIVRDSWWYVCERDVPLKDMTKRQNLMLTFYSKI